VKQLDPQDHKLLFPEWEMSIWSTIDPSTRGRPMKNDVNIEDAVGEVVLLLSGVIRDTMRTYETANT